MTAEPLEAAVYRGRFDERDHRAKMAAWAPLVDHLSRWVDLTRPVLDIGCDRGYFITQVRASERWGVDVQDVDADLQGVHFVQGTGSEVELPQAYFGTVFLSNILEHLPSPDAVIEQLRVASRVLAPGGRVIVLQPNIRLTGPAYWDFIDHRVALTERSLVEAGELAGLRTERLVVRFMPYTTKGRLPVRPALVHWYLRVPILWRLLGQQTLWIATAGPPT